MSTMEKNQQNPSRHASSKADPQPSAMEVDEENLTPSAPEWVGGDTNPSSPSREVIVYATPRAGPGGVMTSQRGPSGRGKSPTLARIRSSPSSIPAPEEPEPNVQELRHSRSVNSTRHPKSPRSPRKVTKSNNASAPPEFSQSRLRPPTLRTREHSSLRRNRVEEDELQDVLAEIIHDQSLTLARAARRQSKLNLKAQGTNRDGGQEGAVINNNDQLPTPSAAGRVSPGRPPLGGATLRSVGSTESLEESPVKPGRKLKTRRQKRKVDVVQDSAAPDDAVMEETPHRGFHPLQNLQEFVSRASTRNESVSTSNTWMELFADVIMWRDVPKSTLLFGAGCFCILSASFIQDVRCGSLTFTAYIALVYLAAVFIHKNFLRGGATAHEPRNWELGEAEALEMLRMILPAVNLVLEKCGQLFCGDPSTTLKVASVLWLLAQAGYFMTIWSFLRFGFLLMFIVPKLYSCYSHQLHGQAEAFANRLWNSWNAYAHKKAAIFGSLVVAWNLSSATSRLYGAFLLLVTIKLYTHHLADPVHDQMETDDPLPVSEQPELPLLEPPRVH
ncbi:unnamed protein product [Calypogeia fissa]